MRHDPWSLNRLSDLKAMQYWKDEKEVRGDSLDDYVDVGEEVDE